MGVCCRRFNPLINMVWNLYLFGNPFIEAAVFLTASAALKVRK